MESMMSYLELKNRKDVIRDRQLEIEAELAEMKRSFIVDKVQKPFEQRVTIEAEIAALKDEANKINISLHAYKKAEAAYKKSHLLNILIGMLMDAGMNEMVRKAERKSLDVLLAELDKH